VVFLIEIVLRFFDRNKAALRAGVSRIPRKDISRVRGPAPPGRVTLSRGDPDWARLDVMTDEEVAAAALSDLAPRETRR
jgi:hypothetical protein